MKDIGLLILRASYGGLMAGHGAQKLFGWFGGHGIKGTSSWLESMGLKPGKPWAVLAGASELGGGVLTALGALNPLGTLGTVGAMSMATAKVHWGKPIWVTAGGAELPVLNIAAALALGLIGPGKFSVDRAIGLCLPRRAILVPGLVLAAVGVGASVVVSNRAQAQDQPAEREQASIAETESELPAVTVPAVPEGMDRSDAPSAEWERVAGAELQGGESADHPV
jgi:putative oxidoreductase